MDTAPLVNVGPTQDIPTQDIPREGGPLVDMGPTAAIPMAATAVMLMEVTASHREAH
ncbi:MAG: hypothetical protein RL685_3713 [Pseudomonadota bacterium]|jgi:hypothetical protein